MSEGDVKVGAGAPDGGWTDEQRTAALAWFLEVMPERITAGDIDGLFGRMPGIFQKLVRKIADAPNYDFAAMELLDAFGIEWRKP